MERDDEDIWLRKTGEVGRATEEDEEEEEEEEEEKKKKKDDEYTLAPTVDVDYSLS